MTITFCAPESITDSAERPVAVTAAAQRAEKSTIGPVWTASAAIPGVRWGTPVVAPSYGELVHLYLVRHGQSHVNLTDLTATHRDSPLTEVGRRQAALVATRIAEHVKPTRIYASTVARAAETAAAVADACGMAVVHDDRLREIGTAYPDGRAIPEDELTPYVPNMWGTLRPYEPVTEGGESWMQFRARVGSFVEELVPARSRFGDPALADAIENERVVVVCHAGVIEAVFEYVFEKGPWSVVAVHTHNGGVSHLQYRPLLNFPDWWLLAHNHVDHLPPELIT
jgi:broad specificity phosphatase PhoE